MLPIKRPKSLESLQSECLSHEEAKDSTQPIEELTPYRIAQREKQLDFGYSNIGYEKYRAVNPTGSHLLNNLPDVNAQCSKRTWDTYYLKWKKELHTWDYTPMPNGYQSNPDWIKNVLPQITQAKKNIELLIQRKKKTPVDSSKENSDSGLVLQFNPHQLLRDSTSPEPKARVNINSFFAAGPSEKSSTINDSKKLSR